MWLSDKLFTIHNKGKKQGKNNKITLNEAYYKYLKKHVHNYEYWNLLGNIKGLKVANLRHMNEFYKLLNHICKTIIYYKIKGAESMSPLQNSTNSFNQYMFLYQNVSKSSSLQTLTTIKNNDSYFAENFNKFDFSDSKCKLRYDDKILDKFTQAKAQGKQTDNGSNGDNNPQNTKLQSSVDQPPSKELVSGNQGAAPNIKSNESTGKTDTLTDTKSELGKSKDKSGIQGSEKKGSDYIQVSQMENSNDEIDTPESSDSGTKNLGSVSEGSNDRLKDAGLGPGNSVTNQEGSYGDQGNIGNDTGTTDNIQEGAGISDSGSTNEPADAQDDKGNQGGSGNESQNLMTQKNDQSITQESSGGIKLQNILNSVKNAFEMYSSSLYETYTDIRNRLHENMSSALENAYTNSRYIVNKVIEQVSEQLQKHPPPEKKKKIPHQIIKNLNLKHLLLHQPIKNHKIHNQ
ncbi:CIR protein PIR protein [Plasmodium vinckei petteri]|uniref:CIR protein PIR protein n=1 Tax=Plasmodium vinckei petteri TaxID=138298 RepID=A0A6V7TEI1_PLAVN|nr:CIR protein PIR protein [Plasmodium vinckei petteri]